VTASRGHSSRSDMTNTGCATRPVNVGSCLREKAVVTCVRREAKLDPNLGLRVVRFVCSSCCSCR
jgi:hypothetical protein